MLGLLSMLFGAGLVLRASASAESHGRRMFVLGVIGLAHAHLLWYGDILLPYAIAGLIVFQFRKWPAGGLLIAGAACVFGTILLASLPIAPPRAVSTETEIAAYTGAYIDQFAHRTPTALRAQTIDLLTYTLPQVAGLMMIGMALTKLGLLTGGRSTQMCAVIAAVACTVGWSATALSGLAADRIADDFVRLAVLTMAEPILSALLAIGYAAALVPVFRWWSPWPLVAVGRTALSCYLLQTIACTTIFYGHGLGWFGRVDRVGQLAVVAVIWIVLLIAAPLWLSQFKLGPAEWAWRRLAR